MTNTKHTPGPWILEDAHESDINYRIFMDKTKVTEHICEVWRTPEETHTEANAKLIAAAPELLEALKMMLSAFEYDNASEYEVDCFWKAKQAINKATT